MDATQLDESMARCRQAIADQREQTLRLTADLSAQELKLQALEDRCRRITAPDRTRATAFRDR